MSKKIIINIIESLDLLFKKIEKQYIIIKEWKNIKENIFSDDEKVQIIDLFIYRFTKIQDMMGNKLFRIFLEEIGEYEKNMFFIDILNKLEKLELIEDAHKWKDYRDLRNILTHEYPDDYQELIKGIKNALIVYVEMKEIYIKLTNCLKKYEIN